MKIENKTISNSVQILRTISGRPFNALASFYFTLNLKALEEIQQVLQQTLRDLFKKYEYDAAEDSEIPDELSVEIHELMDAHTEVEVRKIDISALDGNEIEPAVLSALSFMFKLD